MLGCVDIHAVHTMVATRLMNETNRSASRRSGYPYQRGGHIGSLPIDGDAYVWPFKGRAATG